MRRWLFLLVLLIGGLRSPAQDTIALAPSNEVVLRSFDAQRIARYKVDPDLQYDKDIVQVPSWWERFKAWLAEWFAGLFGEAVAGFFSSYLFLIICGAIIVVAIVIMSRGSLRRVFHGAPRSQAEVITADEDIREMDLASLIAEAERDGDLRRAVRLHYLLVLRQLVDRGVLKWSPERTDRDYMAQIKDEALRSRFAHVALVFQWVWYGHAEVDAERYASIKRPFI
ncbi:MAG TPA: DUF4129 domain-containing protein, partial [Flavobacteriales bacterium]|nr:DUF4129 domain-containing protein [Flavobacteriales bacterium]